MCQIDIVDDIYEQWISLFVDVFIRNLSKSTFKLYGIRRKHSAWTTHVIQWIFFEFHNRKFSIHKVVNERVFDSSNWIYNIRCGFFLNCSKQINLYKFRDNFLKNNHFFWLNSIRSNEWNRIIRCECFFTSFPYIHINLLHSSILLAMY